MISLKNSSPSRIVLVGQRNSGVEQPIHLSPQASSTGTATTIESEFPHERGYRYTQDKLTALRAYRFGTDPRKEQTRDVAVRQFRAASCGHVERVRPVVPDVLKPLLWIGTRQTAQREQPRHEAQLRVSLARADDLRHLVEAREVAARLGCAFALRGHRGTRKIESKIAKGNEPAFFTLHDFCSSSLAQPKTLFNDPLTAGF